LELVDLDGDGRADFHEFYAAAVDHIELLSDQNINLVFKTLDINSNNKIEITELNQLMPRNFNRSGRLS